MSGSFTQLAQMLQMKLEAGENFSLHLLEKAMNGGGGCNDKICFRSKADIEGNLSQQIVPGSNAGCCILLVYVY